MANITLHTLLTVNSFLRNCMSFIRGFLLMMFLLISSVFISKTKKVKNYINDKNNKSNTFNKGLYNNN